MADKTPASELAEWLKTLERRRKYHKLDYYNPYEYQKAFHNAVGFGTDKPAMQKVLLAGNGTGKSICGGMDTAMHLTGMYPDWWKGWRFKDPILAMIGGNTNEAVMNISQKILFGDPNEPQALGSGTVPLDKIGKRTNKTGVPGAFDSVLVRHSSGGWSKALFRAYEQGPKKHMGYRIHLGWLDEEPPQDIWSQYLRGTISTSGILSITFTPESGPTEVVNGFMNNIQQGQALIRASWDDAPHLMKDGKLTPEAQQLESGFPAHEREMRRRGVPTYGTGLVFPFTQEKLEIEPIQIPRHWPRIIGIDFGWDHPAAACMLAWDRDSDIVYLIAEYRESRAIPAIHAAAVKPWGKWPVAWPHDGLNTEKGTGDELVKAYSNEGLDMLPWKATNPPDGKQGQKEGEGGNSVEASILEMYERMETGRFKVFKTCKYWFEEQRTYHRDEKMKLIKVRDDVISASRYAVMMLRHARTEVAPRRRQLAMAGATNW
jgi:phage terminase large subunit-like protein